MYSLHRQTYAQMLTQEANSRASSFPQACLRIAVVTILVCGACLKAYSETATDRLTLIVFPLVQIDSAEVKLGEISRINVQHGAHDALAKSLKAISLGEAPPPRMKKTITGYAILAAIENSGVSRDEIGYSIPKTVVIERRGRLITTDEVLAEAHSFFGRDESLDVQVREVRWSSAQAVPEGETKIELNKLGQPQRGKIPLRATVFVNGQPEARFLLTAIVDDWREVPVLNAPLERGMMIKPSDIEMVRLNLFKQPEGIAENASDVVGRRVTRNLSAGETIRSKFIDIPPTVPKGKTVTMNYRSAGIQATALGIAMDDGLDGEVIRVKNSSSRKIVRARISGPEQVEVQSK